MRRLLRRALPSPVRRVLRRPFWAVRGRLGLPPTFLIIGAQRGGTTSLYRYLVQHPAILPADSKELHYFDYQYHKGRWWYLSQFPLALLAGDALTGEATPYYLYHPHAPARIQADLPDARLIVLLRDPVERAFSHFKLNRKKGRERPDVTFEAALEMETERLVGESERLAADSSYHSQVHQHHSYLAKGLYIEQLPRWQAIFPPEQLLVLRSEDLYTQPAAVLAQTFAFLGLPDYPLPEYMPYNASDSDPSYAGRMRADTRARLVAFFRPYNAQLYDLLGRDFGWQR